jgi:hypothetical protein
MTEWILIIGCIVGGFLLATHAAGVGFIASRVFISGRRKLKQFSPSDLEDLAGL